MGEGRGGKDMMAYGLFLHEQHGVNMLVQVCCAGGGLEEDEEVEGLPGR